MNVAYNVEGHLLSEADKGCSVIPCMEVYSVLLERRFKRPSHALSETERMFLFPLDLTEALVLVCDASRCVTFGDVPMVVGSPISSIRYTMPVKGQVYHFHHDFSNHEDVVIHRTPAGYKLRNADRTNIFEVRTFRGVDIIQFMDNK